MVESNWDQGYKEELNHKRVGELEDLGSLDFDQEQACCGGLQEHLNQAH